ncbi:hypothetical protein [Candidatus Mesenet endosymbiont of Phosphuga atrata]|uniref:hypothetical protein n=1 Tax=Candidatus Mesenet endosymbiont of Phosphuga atrata TaxID=3066221 RepID=UPI0030CD68D0
MNSNQGSKSKEWSEKEFSNTYERVSEGVYGTNGGNMLSARGHVNSFADRVKEDRHAVFNELLCAAVAKGDSLVVDYCRQKGADPSYDTYGNKTLLESVEFFKPKEKYGGFREWEATDNAYGKPNSSLDKCSYSNQKKQSKGKNDEEECILM